MQVDQHAPARSWLLQQPPSRVQLVPALSPPRTGGSFDRSHCGRSWPCRTSGQTEQHYLVHRNNLKPADCTLVRLSTTRRPPTPAPEEVAQSRRARIQPYNLYRAWQNLTRELHGPKGVAHWALNRTRARFDIDKRGSVKLGSRTAYGPLLPVAAVSDPGTCLRHDGRPDGGGGE